MLFQNQSWIAQSLKALSVASVLLITPTLNAQQRQTSEPVHRVAKANTANEDKDTDAGSNVPAMNASSVKPKGHSLDKAIDYASNGLIDIQNELHDYTGMLVKRERVNGRLTETEYIKFKIRNEREVDGEKVPFSIYLRFLKPSAVRGREVIWIDGANKGKLIAHDNPNSLRGKITVKLDPEGAMAMEGNRYPVYEAGIENLVRKLVEKGKRDRECGDCIVNYSDNASINRRPCSMIEVVHPEPNGVYEFWKAKIYIDQELNLPVRYVCWDWPKDGEEKGQLIEEYTYVNLEINVGLSDEDFDSTNEDYDF